MNPSKSRDLRFWHRWVNAGAVKLIKLDMEVWCGREITRTIAEAIENAGYADNLSKMIMTDPDLACFLSVKIIPRSIMSFNFNGVKVSVCHDSDPKLIYRDWERAQSGYIAKKICPYPKAELSVKDLANDQRIHEANEARWVKESAERKVVQDQKEREFYAELNTCPAMDRDETKWQEGINAQKGGLDLGIFAYAEYWARLMQKGIMSGRKLEDIADEYSYRADIPCGMSGYTYGIAVSILANCWKHGEELRVWHNKKYQLKDEGDKANASGGVLNPALLCID